MSDNFKNSPPSEPSISAQGKKVYEKYTNILSKQAIPSEKLLEKNAVAGSRSLDDKRQASPAIPGAIKLKALAEKRDAFKGIDKSIEEAKRKQSLKASSVKSSTKGEEFKNQKETEKKQASKPSLEFPEIVLPDIAEELGTETPVKSAMTSIVDPVPMKRFTLKTAKNATLRSDLDERSVKVVSKVAPSGSIRPSNPPEPTNSTPQALAGSGISPQNLVQKPQ